MSDLHKATHEHGDSGGDPLPPAAHDHWVYDADDWAAVRGIGAMSGIALIIALLIAGWSIAMGLAGWIGAWWSGQ